MMTFLPFLNLSEVDVRWLCDLREWISSTGMPRHSLKRVAMNCVRRAVTKNAMILYSGSLAICSFTIW